MRVAAGGGQSPGAIAGRARRWALAVLLFAFGGFAVAQNAESALVDYQGTLGPARIGLTLVVHGGNAITAGHYFYARYLADIPLAGSLQSGSLTLKGQDGGAFALSFVGNGSEGGKPLGFGNSVGLEGTWSKDGWSKDGKTLPVKLSMSSQSPQSPGGRRYAMVTDESDAVFEGRVQSFRKAALGGFREAAAYNCSFPLRVNRSGKSRIIRSAAQLSAEWKSIFTPAYLAALKRDIPHDLGVVQGQAMLGQGDAFFGSKGATALNVP